MLITVGAITKKLLVVNDELKVKRKVTLTFTMDNRIVDYARASSIYKKFISYLNNPDACAKEDLISQ
jgi:pyruvate/2-oxoglutarate dehydrogenase complex dihydrolipoamide acyltransferase (E2) component